MNTLTNQTVVSDTKPLRIAAILMLLALLSACGSKITPRETSLYSGSGPLNVSPLNPAGEGQAECSMFDSTSTRLSGKVTTYYYSGTLQEDKVRVRISSIVDGYDTNANYFIQAFRWKMNGSTVTLDETPVQFTFEKGNGSASPISAQLSSVHATTLARIRTEHSISGSGAVDFFSKSTMVFTGVDYNWQALKIVIYDGSTTPATVVGQSDFLLPVIQANPNKYAATHHSTLNQLHPFWSQRSQALSESEWANRAQSFCF